MLQHTSFWATIIELCLSIGKVDQPQFAGESFEVNIQTTQLKASFLIFLVLKALSMFLIWLCEVHQCSLSVQEMDPVLLFVGSKLKICELFIR